MIMKVQNIGKPTQSILAASCLEKPLDYNRDGSAWITRGEEDKDVSYLSSVGSAWPFSGDTCYYHVDDSITSRP